jgi:uncharacterized protein DUF4124
LTSRHHLAWLALAAIAVPSLSGAQPKTQVNKLYRWTDEKGVVHYGDSVPPEYSKNERNILNNQGVKVGFEEGEITPEKRAELDRIKAEQEQQKLKREEIVRRDKMLLDTYLSVADIEDLRDRRVELLESQIKVTELYLANLRKRLVALQEEAGNYKPYTTREGAPQIPENLQLDISRTSHSINLYEQTLARTRSDEETLRSSFDSDIRRFKELKGI